MKLYVLLVTLSISIGAGCTWLNKLGSFKVSTIASGLFVAERPLENIEKQELSLFFGIINTIPVQIDYEKKTVSTKNTTAVFRPGLGVVLTHRIETNQIKKLAPSNLVQPTIINDSLPWPIGNNITKDTFQNVNLDSINSAINFAFQEPNKRKNKRNTRGVVVIYKGQLIAEKYAEDKGFKSDTRQIGWSMTKSVLNTLVGLRVASNKLNLNDNSLIEAWSDSSDSRKSITINNLLQMSTGLDSDEGKDVIDMIYCENDMAQFGALSNQTNVPNEKWYYSSLTSNVLSGVVRNSFEDDETYWNFPRKELFNKIGMSSAIFETDATGTFIGSSFLWATPRDWARFGQLYLQNGKWNNEQILPENWVDYSTTKAPASDGRYGAHFWLNRDHSYSDNLSVGTYQSRGLFGQQVIIVPSKDLVIVRMGLNTKLQTTDTEWLEYKYWTNEYSTTFVNKIIDAIE